MAPETQNCGTRGSVLSWKQQFTPSRPIADLLRSPGKSLLSGTSPADAHQTGRASRSKSLTTRFNTLIVCERLKGLKPTEGRDFLQSASTSP